MNIFKSFRIVKLAIIAVSLIFVGHGLLAYALPPSIFLSLFGLFAIIFLWASWQNTILLTLSFVLATIALNQLLAILDIGSSIYYRPHEVFATYDQQLGHGRYQANVDFTMTMPHGDLWALAIDEGVIPEPRSVTFKTDAFGFRNSADYAGQQLVIIGDSFVVANGSTQEAVLTEQLRADYGINAYNLSFPGNISSYAKYLDSFEKLTDKQPRAILVLFEGNDFPLEKDEPSTGDPLWHAERYYKIFNNQPLYRVMFSLTRRFFYQNIIGKKERVESYIIGNRQVAFYKKHRIVSERNFVPQNSVTEDLICGMKGKLSFILFVPTKYRVYYEHIVSGLDLAEANAPQLPHAQFEFLKLLGGKCDIAVHDLTPELIEASDRLLSKQQYTYWTDDTHWNQHGIAVAAKLISEKERVRREENAEQGLF